MDYQMCSRCVMDTTDPEITFEEMGVCNHCEEWDRRMVNETFMEKNEDRTERLAKFVEQVKLDGGCLLGLSGGMDSSYALLKLIELGVKPFILVYDNGWNTHVANANISALIGHFGLEHDVVKINADIYRDVQLAFLRSGVMNAEIPTDHFLASLLYQVADRKGLRYIVHGGNVQNESIMPKAWGYDAQDWKHIVEIYSQHGEKSVREIYKLPHMTLWDWFNYTFLRGIKWFPILNYFDYDPYQAEKELVSLGWRSYGEKHTESIYTAVFQQYILPHKFGIDKRRAHYSSLINAGWLERESALSLLEKPMTYDSSPWVDYVCKQLKINRGQFDVWMAQAPVPHEFYASNKLLLKLAKPVVRLARKVATVSA